jgi:hypothetical protein
MVIVPTAVLFSNGSNGDNEDEAFRALDNLLEALLFM